MPGAHPRALVARVVSAADAIVKIAAVLALAAAVLAFPVLDRRYVLADVGETHATRVEVVAIAEQLRAERAAALMALQESLNGLARQQEQILCLLQGRTWVLDRCLAVGERMKSATALGDTLAPAPALAAPPPRRIR